MRACAVVICCGIGKLSDVSKYVVLVFASFEILGNVASQPVLLGCECSVFRLAHAVVSASEILLFWICDYLQCGRILASSIRRGLL